MENRKRGTGESGLNAENDKNDKNDKNNWAQPGAKRSKTAIENINLESAVYAFDEKKAIKELIESAPKAKEASSAVVIELISTLERANLKNARKRAKYSENPEKFMDSEIELAQATKNLNAVTVAPHLYPKLAQLNLPRTIAELLSHENADVAIEAAALLEELLDPAAALESPGAARAFFAAVAASGAFELVVDNLERVAASEDDSQGLYSALSVFENLIEIDPGHLLTVLRKTDLLKFLLKTIGNLSFSDESNRFFCAELLANFVNVTLDICPFLLDYGFIAVLETSLCKIAQKGQITPEESEFINNLLNVTTTVLISTDSVSDSIPPDLFKALLTLLRESRFKCRASVLNVISAAMIKSKENCHAFVEQGGLKTVFLRFKKAGAMCGRPGAQLSAEHSEAVEHILIVLLQCFMKLEGPSYQRFFGKFLENSCEKIDTVATIFDFLQSKSQENAKSLAAQNPKFLSLPIQTQFLRVFAKTGIAFTLCAALAAFVFSSGALAARSRVAQVLSQADLGLADVRAALAAFAESKDEDDGAVPLPLGVVRELMSLLVHTDDPQ